MSEFKLFSLIYVFLQMDLFVLQTIKYRSHHSFIYIFFPAAFILVFADNHAWFGPGCFTHRTLSLAHLTELELNL